MKYLLIALTALLAIIGWLKPARTPIWLVPTALVLILAVALVQVFITLGEQREKRAAAFTGTLRGRKIVLSGQAKVFPKLEIGDSGAILMYAGPQGAPLLRIFEDTSLEIWLEDGKLKVSTQIRDKVGRLVAELRANEWTVKPERVWDRNYSDDALEVVDETGDVVLQVRLVEDRVQFAGKFYSRDGRGVGIGRMTTPLGTGGVFEITGPEHPVLQLHIEPLFNYPSRMHLGEIIRK
jgi:hypothetical protein